jgi:hypothetical protein
MNSENGTLTLPEIPGLSIRMQYHGEIPDAEAMEAVSPLQLGDSLEIQSNRTVEMTIEFSTRLLQLPEFVVNDSTVDRNLRGAHVDYLASCMKKGTFRPEFVTIVTCVCEEKFGDNPPFSEFRMNGQHCCWARQSMPTDWRCPVRHIKYKAKTLQDMRLLYVSIDRGAPRTSANVVNAYLAGTELFAGVPRKVIALLASGLAIWLDERSDGGRLTMDPDTKAVLMQTTHKDVTAQVKDWLTVPGRSQHDVWIMFARAPVIAALFATFDKLPSRAHEFWNVVADGLGITVVNDPRFRLRERLKGSSLYSQKSRKEIVNQEMMYSWCINAWNSWRAGKELSLLKTSYSGIRPKAK